MDSSFHYSIDLNKDHQNHHEQPFFYALGSSSSHLLHHHHQQQQVPSTSPSSSTSISSLSSYLPFLINSQEDQQFAFNNTYDHLHLSESLKGKMLIMTNDGSSSSYDHMVPKKEIRLKLTIRKKDHHEDRTNQNPTKLNNQDSDKWIMSPKMRLIKKTITNDIKESFDHTNNKTNFDKDHHEEDLKNGYGYNYNNNGFIRVCSDCNTTKTPLWRSGPQGPKSLCNACGIRQRKARRAAMVAAVAAAGDHEIAAAARLQQLPLKKKLQNKKKRSNGGENLIAKAKKCRIKEVPSIARDSEIISTGSDSSILSNKIFLNDLTTKLSKSSAYNQQVFPQDEKEAAILLMALSYGMVQG